MTAWLVAAAAAVAAVWWIGRVSLGVLRPVRRPPERTPAGSGVEHTDVTLGGAHPLEGWWLEPAEDRGGAVVALAHGWAANAAVLLPLGVALARGGHPVLLFDFRGHGRSPDAPYITVRHYRDDTLHAVRHVRERHPGRVLVVGGHSMGGAAALLAAADGAGAAGVVMVASPADVLEVTATYLGERGLPGRLLVSAMYPFWSWLAGESLSRLVPERRIGDFPGPVLVVHPELDRRVPMEHAERLGGAENAQVVVIPGAGHGDVLERPEAHRAVLEFVEGLERAAPAAAGDGEPFRA